MEWLSIVASVIELLGLYLVSRKNKFGFLVNMIAGLSWILYTLLTGHAIGLLFVCSVALVINFRGYCFWNKTE